MGAYDTLTAGLSGAGLVLLGAVTVSGSSDFHLNAWQLQEKLQATAESALIESGQTWATVVMEGQSARVSGAPPSVDAAERARDAVLTSAGNGGLLFGGVLSVTTEFSEIRDLPLASPFVWRAIKSANGNLTFVGAVPDHYQRSELAAYATSLSPMPLDDRTQLTRGVPSGDWIGTAKFGLDQLALLDSGEARLTDYELRLSGIAMEDRARIEATASISSLTDPWVGVARIDGPSHWKAEHVDGTLVLSGSCETAEDRAEIAELAETYFDGPVIDEMIVSATEYEPWIQGVRVGLPHFTSFKSGQMGFAPDEGEFRFGGMARGSTLQFLREDMSDLETNYAVEIAAETAAVELDEISGVDLGEDPLTACQRSFDLILASNEIEFEADETEISRESGQTLDKLMAVSETCDDTLHFEVYGLPDVTDESEGDLAIADARALAVITYMRDAGFDVSRLSVGNAGATVRESDSAETPGQPLNRRIEIKVQKRSG